jgi:GABA(A) receptor-associated protein
MFKEIYHIDERKYHSERVLSKYPGRVPIICEKKRGCKLPDMDKNKFLVPHEFGLDALIVILRKKM